MMIWCRKILGWVLFVAWLLTSGIGCAARSRPTRPYLEQSMNAWGDTAEEPELAEDEP
jgi:hypothetical protein